MNIIHGDCIDHMKLMAPESIDLVFADPPFNIGYGYDDYEDSMEPVEYEGWCLTWMSRINRLLKPHGTFWLAIGDEYAAELKVLARDLDFTYRSWVIWYYTFGVNCSNKFSRSHTHLLYFIKDPKQFTFNSSAIKVLSARQRIYNDKRAKAGGRLPDDTWLFCPEHADMFTPDQDTWLFPRVCGTFHEREGWHPCQMPVALMERIVLACSNPGDHVLDPFLGSGTTGVAAKRHGRTFTGIDISADYCVAALERIQSTVREGNLDDQTA
jgi:site-specific DNA-methyltransferase (adenine-specific)